MATLHRFKDDGTACFANVRMDNGKRVNISIAQSGVIVKCSRVGLFGQKLFESKNAEHAVKVTIALGQAFPDHRTPAMMSNPVLKAYCNAVLHCRSADEVAKVMNQPIDLQNSTGTSQSTENKRARLMGLAMRRAVFWGVLAQVIWATVYLATGVMEGQWPEGGQGGFLVFPLVAIGYFLWKRANIGRELETHKF